MSSNTPSYGFTVRLELKATRGVFAAVTRVIARLGAEVGAVDLVQATQASRVRDVQVTASSVEHAQKVIHALGRLKPAVKVVSISDRTFLMHLGGKIEIKSKIPLTTRESLSMAYTPGVARVCTAIAEEPRKAFRLTIKKNCVAVVSDGSAVLGLGNIGPEAAMPVMEGKAMLFKEFGGVDAFPICLKTQDTEEIIRIVSALEPTFGGINLEDISAPRCFEIESRLQEAMQIPVFHDDQHGTAVVALAALLNAAKVVKKPFQKLKVMIAGVGAAGVACARIFQHAGLRDIIMCDKSGTLYEGRAENMNPVKEEMARLTNRSKLKGPIDMALRGRDVFLGVSGASILKASALRKMARHPIVFALANPTPEVDPDEAMKIAAVLATGRSDYPNQINNVLCFPGIFKGALKVYARQINPRMKMAAAKAIAGLISPAELSADYIIPSVFDKRVAQRVARAVSAAAVQTGVSRKMHLTTSEIHED